MTRTPALAAVALLLALSACGGGSDDKTTTAPTPGTTQTQAATSTASPPLATLSEPASNISLPDRFEAFVIATGFFRPTSIAAGEDGALYVAERDGVVNRLTDDDADGLFETQTKFADTSGEITGILATPDNGLYISTTGIVVLVHDTNDDGQADEYDEIVSGLPNGRHQNNGLALRDGKLYITNGSDCDDCTEEDERSAAILQSNADGSDLRVFAHGLRNPYDITFDAQGRLWSTDNGSDDPCATVDELNLIVDGGEYGWPYAEDGCDNFADGIAPIASLGLHTASTGIASYDAEQFPESYRGNLFATVWGSYFGEPELPPQLLRAVIDDSTSPPTATVETFGDGFHHPIDVLVNRDGTLLVLDYGEDTGENDTSGTVYRIVYAAE